ncbi:MAG: hypothetical protein ACJAVI_005636 [Candidatus Azotimanducaceae bacterium]|jgi:hypothetical protein
MPASIRFIAERSFAALSTTTTTHPCCALEFVTLPGNPSTMSRRLTRHHTAIDLILRVRKIPARCR